MLLNKFSVFDLVLIVLAVIGLIAVLGVAGMWLMHAGMMHSMMHGLGGCLASGRGMLGH